MLLVLDILFLIIDLFIIAVVAHVIIHWLVMFDIINIRKPQAQKLVELLHKITDPVMRPIQQYVPPIAGIDLTPIIVIFLAEILKRVIYSILV